MEIHTCVRFTKWTSGMPSQPKMTFHPKQARGFCSTAWNTDGRGGTTAVLNLSPNSVCTLGRTIVHEIVHGLAGDCFEILIRLTLTFYLPSFNP